MEILDIQNEYAVYHGERPGVKTILMMTCFRLSLKLPIPDSAMAQP